MYWHVSSIDIILIEIKEKWIKTIFSTILFYLLEVVVQDFKVQLTEINSKR